MTNSTKPDRRFAVSQREKEKGEKEKKLEEGKQIRFAFYR